MTYVGKKPADIIATAVDTTTGTFSGDLTVDTNTLYVDSANNRVGVGTVSPSNVLHVHQTDATSNSYVHITQADGGSGGTDGLSIGIEDGGVNAVIRNRENGYLRMYTNNTERMRITSGGDFQLYEDTGTTPKLFWDASAERLGVGHSSPNVTLHVQGANVSSGDANHNVVIDDTTSMAQGVGGGIVFRGNYGSGLTNGGFIQTEKSNGTSGNYAFDLVLGSRANGSSPAERMRIDSSGNLLVGKTSTAFGTEGIVIAPEYISATRDSGESLVVNRTSTDGELIGLYRQSSKVGSIGVRGGDSTYIESTASSRTGLDFSGGILPRYNGALSNGSTSLGAASYRFSDLYLSGGAYIGGTGSANYLDDYETGDFDPAITRATTGVSTTYEYQRGYYIKVGALVTLFINIKTNTVSNTGSGSVVITNLPFASTSDVGFRASGSIAYQDMFSTTTVENLRLNMPESSSAIYLMVQDLDSITVDSNLVANPLSARFLQASITYKTDS